jgi:NADPH:quinone reductase-like Zn-dependent oxidoreductase
MPSGPSHATGLSVDSGISTISTHTEEKIMKAVRIHSYGGPEVIRYEDAPRPTIAADEVLVAVHATAINPVDLATRAGHFQSMIPVTFPLTLGLDLSGVVAEVGPNVTGVAVGDAVFGYSNMMRQGADAEYAVVSATEIAPKPRSLDFVAAAAVPVTGLTAWQALKAADLQAGQSVLIHGAGGGVGSLAVQFAVAKGARVIATAAGDKLDMVRELGAAEVIDYTTTRFEDVVRGVDVVLATVGGEVIERSWGVLKPGGILVTPAGEIDAEAVAARGVRGTGMLTQPNGAQLTEIAALIDAGAVKPVVSTVLPLTEAAQAHELADSGHARGKIVLQVVA